MDTIESAQSNWPRALYITGAVFVLFLLQHYFRRFEQPIETIYFTILFDSIALTGLVMIASSYLTGPLARLSPARWQKYQGLQKQFGLIGLMLVVLHVVISLAVLTPAYYPGMFAESGKLSQAGQISMLAGPIAFIIFLIAGIASLPSVAARMTERGWHAVGRLGLIALVLSVIHFAVFKWEGWLGPNWVSGIPPGTLVATVFVVLVFLIRGIAYLRKD